MPDPLESSAFAFNCVTPTELKDLRNELHEVEQTHSTALHRVEVVITNGITKLATENGLFKWLIGLTLVAALTRVISSAYWAGSQASQLSALESRSEKTDARLDRVVASLGTISIRLERIEANILKAIGRPDEAKATNPEKR